MSGYAEAQRPAGCGTDKKLLPTQNGGDLVIKGERAVESAGIEYKFGNVNIIAGGVLEFSDAAIDFWAANILGRERWRLIAGSPRPSARTAASSRSTSTARTSTTGTPPEAKRQGITCLSGDASTAPCGVPQESGMSNVDAYGKPVPSREARRISQITLPRGATYPPVKRRLLLWVSPAALRRRGR